MNITKQQLKEIILEELSEALEAGFPPVVLARMQEDEAFNIIVNDFLEHKRNAAKHRKEYDAFIAEIKQQISAMQQKIPGLEQTVQAPAIAYEPLDRSKEGPSVRIPAIGHAPGPGQQTKNLQARSKG